jgi:hypothetical protein
VPKTTKSVSDRIADLRSQIEIAAAKEQTARLNRERLENQLHILELRNGGSTQTVVVDG